MFPLGGALFSVSRMEIGRILAQMGWEPPTCTDGLESPDAHMNEKTVAVEKRRPQSVQITGNAKNELARI